MLQKKICMLGAFGVGKTSLVRRFVDTIFSDNYLTTVGVKLDKKTLAVGAETVNLILWDIAGEDDTSAVRTTYLRGSAGYLLVADGTRASTLDVACSIHSRAEAEIGRVPFMLLVNKCDLRSEWAIPESRLDELAALGWTIRPTSAKTGESVEAAFQEFAERAVR
jgi:small GTP-binding protein